MIALSPDRVRWIFVHTADYRGAAGVEEIRRWHADPPPNGRGWDDIGYHYVIRRDGTIEAGRSTRYAGAHVQGVNSRSIGICCEGHGDSEPHTPEQRRSLRTLCRAAMDQYAVPADGVLGHREVNGLVDAGEVGEAYRTPKTCPGRMVDMDEIRAALVVPDDLPEPDIGMVDSGIHPDPLDKPDAD